MADILVSDKKNIFNPNSMTFDERQKDLEEQDKREAEARKKTKNSPYSNWYQFNREYSKEMIYLAGKYPKAHQILLFLLDQMDNYNAVMCSNVVLCEALGIGRTTVSTSIKVLKEHGFITIYKSGNSNVYAVNKNLAWSSWGNNFKYAKFDAKIIITESEQEREEPKITTEKFKQVSVKKPEN